MAERVKHSDDRNTIAGHLERCGVDRREFLTFCGKLMVVAPAGLALTRHLNAEEVAATLETAKRPSVIWLHFQECTGCTETLLRATEPDLADLIFNLISLDYHETVMAAAGYQAEKALNDAMEQNRGKYVLVVEGAVPTKSDGNFCKVAGKTAKQMLTEAAEGAAAIISIGSCASWGGIPSAGDNPTGAVGVDKIITNKPIINIPGCPPNPYILMGTVLQYATHGSLPALDESKRPLFAYDRKIHDQCPRRAHFDAGEFALEFGDEGHRHGWCLYRLGCKGPATHASCSTRHFNNIVDAWPIGVGSPCAGCTEESVAFKVPLFETVDVARPVPPDTYPAIFPDYGGVSPVATGVAGVIGGGLVGAAIMASRKLGKSDSEEGGEETKE